MSTFDAWLSRQSFYIDKLKNEKGDNAVASYTEIMRKAYANVTSPKFIEWLKFFSYSYNDMISTYGPEITEDYINFVKDVVFKPKRSPYFMQMFEIEKGKTLRMMLQSSNKESPERSKESIIQMIKNYDQDSTNEDANTKRQKEKNAKRQRGINFARKMNTTASFNRWLEHQSNFIATMRKDKGNIFANNYIKNVKIRFDTDQAIYNEDTPFVERIIQASTKEDKRSIYKEYIEKFDEPRIQKFKKRLLLYKIFNSSLVSPMSYYQTEVSIPEPAPFPSPAPPAPTPPFPEPSNKNYDKFVKEIVELVNENDISEIYRQYSTTYGVDASEQLKKAVKNKKEQLYSISGGSLKRRKSKSRKSTYCKSKRRKLTHCKSKRRKLTHHITKKY